MSFLSNEDLKPFLLSPVPLVSGLREPLTTLDGSGPLEACAIKLRVGRILQMSPGEPALARMLEHNSASLKQGEMTFVLTEEVITLPSDIGAFMFSKSGGISERGILITNTGHVDPGYKGKLRFAVINMGNDLFTIRTGDYLVKIIFFKLGRPCDPDWGHMHSPLSEPTEKDLRPLGREFAAFAERSREIAKKIVDERFFSVGYFTLFGSTAASIVVAFFSVFIAYFALIESQIDRRIGYLEQRIENLTENSGE